LEKATPFRTQRYIFQVCPGEMFRDVHN
jgi:hypothetical protein